MPTMVLVQGNQPVADVRGELVGLIFVVEPIAHLFPWFIISCPAIR